MSHLLYLRNLLTFYDENGFYIHFELMSLTSTPPSKKWLRPPVTTTSRVPNIRHASNVIRTFRFDGYDNNNTYVYRDTPSALDVVFFFFVRHRATEVSNLPYNLIMSSIRFREKPFGRDKNNNNNNKKNLSLFQWWNLPTPTRNP